MYIYICRRCRDIGPFFRKIPNTWGSKPDIRSGISAGYNSVRAYDHCVRVKSVANAKI